jgi:cyclic beta-1,2-glucan synthetase
LTRFYEGRLDTENIILFTNTIQTIAPLKIGEIWALVMLLRLSVLELLAASLANIQKVPFHPAYPSPVIQFETETNPEKHSQVSASDETIVSNCILGLRLLDTRSWQSFFENTSLVEAKLCTDPSKTYSLMDFNTRNCYRNVIEELGQGSAMSEVDIAQAAIDLASQSENQRQQHVGFYLIGPGREKLEAHCQYHISPKKRFHRWGLHQALPLYLTSIMSGTLLLGGLAAGYAAVNQGSIWQIILALLLTLLPASAVTIHIINWIVTQVVPPRSLPRLNFQDGVPPEFSTLVVIPSLLKNENELHFLLKQIENHFIGNADPSIHFALLTDFADAPQKEMPGEQQLIEKTKAEITRLNNRYGSETYRPFLLLHRERGWNPAENCWMAWERKRGKLEELNRLLLKQTPGSFTVQFGDLSIFPSIRYIVTADADSILPRDSVRRLIGTLSHPLNQPEFDPISGKITDGYTVLQPRVQVHPAVANLSIFTRSFSGDVTLDLYSLAVSDIYQDLFAEGNFVGKGIYDLHAFERSMFNRVPENSILSHDLFEGLHGRCGLVTDITLFDDYPLQYLAFMHRLHRWVRGDWQLLPWLLPKVPSQGSEKICNNFSMLGRWKIFDNLRRSLVASATLALLLGGWLLLPNSVLVWTVLALSPYIMEFLTTLLSNLRNRKPNDPPDVTAQPLRKTALRLALDIVFLPHRVLVELDAILATLVRLTITRKHLLQWMTAAHTVYLLGRELKAAVAWREMVTASLLALAILVGMIAWNHINLLLAAPLLFVWLLSPYIAARISHLSNHPPARLNPDQQHSLRMLARTTWLFFEHFVGPEDHWLPPDHFQEDPRGLIAHRTSPTNIGLLLVSNLAAYDLGYIGVQELVQRLKNTFHTLNALEKVRGHFLNWYDTQTLEPLSPKYVSTVDSGNLAACLLVVRQGLKDICERPVVQWGGLVDTLDILLATLDETHLGESANQLHAAILDLREQASHLKKVKHYAPHLLITNFRESQAKIEALLINLIETSSEKLDQGTLNRLSTWVDRARSHLSGIEYDLQTLAPWSEYLINLPPLLEQDSLKPELAATWLELQELFATKPALEGTPAICAHGLKILQHLENLLTPENVKTREWCQSFAAKIGMAHQSALLLLREIELLEDDIDELFNAMDFSFLFNQQRQVFHIGLNVETDRLDSNYYDLLASEARTASLIAISKGDVPQSHWMHLARPLTLVKNSRTLISWSGTMFEYLMPSLFMKRYPGTLLEQSCQAAIQCQIAYSDSKNVPWGISESGFYYFDAAQSYQYRAFGVQALGYKRGLDDDLVITPYASLLALPFAPQAVVQNIDHMRKYNMCGLYGFYEALDFTVKRLSAGQEFAQVRSYMAHHQGMILLALDNYLVGNSLVRRFHADPRIKNTELLLQEQIPLRIETEKTNRLGGAIAAPARATVALDPWSISPNAPFPQVHILSNGNYSLLISASGSSYSRWADLDLTRWHADATLDNWGTWLYLRDEESGQLWSATSQPIATSPESQKVEFYPHRAEFERRDDEISVRVIIDIAANDDVEIRRVTVTNHSDQTRQLSLTSYAEVILTTQEIDRRHPAFNRLFIESEHIEDGQILLFHRRPRSAKEKPVYLAHFVALKDENVRVAGFETDRAKFLGNGGDSRQPSALLSLSGLAGSTGATLDPIFAIQTQLTLLPYQSQPLAYVTLAASSRKKALELALNYQQRHNLRNAFSASVKETENELRHLKLTSHDLERFQKLLSALLYPSPALRADPATLADNTLGQPGLWPFSISGDYPILLARVTDNTGIQLLNELIQAHTYWRRHGMLIDLVILNQQETSYNDQLTGQIHRLLSQTNSEGWLNKPGGIFVLRADQVSDAENILLATAARTVLDDTAGPLAEQLKKLDEQPVRLPRFIATRRLETPPSSEPGLERPGNLLFDNGLGGFSPDGREYVIYLVPGQWTPAPWINVIANPDFGFLVSSNGLGCTWAQNSGENRLTPWHNDPVSDPPSEAIYLRDEDTGQIWSPTPLPARADAPYLIRHGAGYSIFEHASHGLYQTLRVFVVPDQPVKVIQLKLENTTSRTRRVNITYYAEWVLGNVRDTTAQYIIPEFDSQRFALLARNPYNLDFSQNVAFLAATRELNWVTTDRSEFLGLQGSYACPDALSRVGLAASVQAGSDPCAALQTLLWLAPGESKEVTFLIGEGADRTQANNLITKYQDVAHIQTAWEAVKPFWERHLEVIQVETPEPAMNILLNHWLLYETLACRIWGRTALYQSSGAFGFRDQLQDVLAVLHSRPELTRAQILNAAQHQFEAGDVLHWWHPPFRRGIRTRISDNLLWLPYVTAQYVQTTGDMDILAEKIPFLKGEPLKEGEEERYGQFIPSEHEDTLYEHCLRALRKGVTAGLHGLPLMGSGDWNDGMNRVGIEGKGESVWLGWFAYAALMDFASLCEKIGEISQAETFSQQAETLKCSLEASSWDGEWYRRAYFDDGTALGSAERHECTIDSISQSWAVLSKAADPQRAQIAMDSLYECLVRPELGLIQLLDPPFNLTLRDPGYIKGYPPGIRENGGQYTHAAAWAIWAFADLGDGDRAGELFRLINPIHHTDTPEKAAHYRVEPYVIAADVYSQPPHAGRGGWTWYTGSSGWMYRLGLEAILGFRRVGQTLEINPCIPKKWPGYKVNYRFGSTCYRISVENPEKVNGGLQKVMMDGKPLSDSAIPLLDDGQVHEVQVVMGESSESGRTTSTD